jgi:hypothetical protein
MKRPMGIKGSGIFVPFWLEGFLKRKKERMWNWEGETRNLQAGLWNYYEICHLRQKKRQKDEANM